MNRSIQNQVMLVNFRKRTKKFERSGNSISREKSFSSLRASSSKTNIRSCFLPMPETINSKKNQNIAIQEEFTVTCPYCQKCIVKVKNRQCSLEGINRNYQSQMLNEEKKKKKKNLLQKSSSSDFKVQQDKGIIKLKSTLSKLRIEQLQAQNKSLQEEIKLLQTQLSHTKSLENILTESQKKIIDLNQKNVHLHHQYAFQQKSLLQELNQLKIGKDQAYVNMKEKYKQLMGQYMKLFKVNLQLVTKKSQNRPRDQDSTELQEESFLISEDQTSHMIL